MQTWETIRLRCRRDKEKIKAVARELGIAPNTVRKYLRTDGPPKRTAKPRAKILDAYKAQIDALLLSTPKITAVRIGSYLRQNVDASLTVDERTLREYVAERRTMLVPKEAFVRATYAPGDQSQFDFSPMPVNLGGVLVKVELFVVRLSYSGHFAARASMHCDQPALFAGLLSGFTTFGGVTRTSVFDNASTAVRRILRGRNRDENEAFLAFRGALALDVAFAAPAKGNEKGGVEGVHGFIEDNFFRPTPSFADLDALNVALAAFCAANLNRKHTTHGDTIGERFARERPTLRPLPAVLPRACVIRYARVNKFAEVCFERNLYSVPTRFAHRDAMIEIYEDRLQIVVGEEAVAQHRRGFGTGERFLDPRHYLSLLQHKHRAARTALVLADGRIPSELNALFETYKNGDAAKATKRWMQVLALLADAPAEELAQTVSHALARGTNDPAAIALLLQQRLQPLPAADIDSQRLPLSAQIPAPAIDLYAYETSQLVENAV